MAVYSSGSIRFNGLGNDTNFDEMIEKLYKIESRQVTQLMRWKSDWQTRLDAFKELRGELMNLQSALTKLNSMSKFMAKTAASSDDKVASAVAGANSVDGAYNVVVDNLAKAYSWSQNTGLYHKSDVICTQDGGGAFSYTYKGITRTISVPKNTTAEGLVKLINNDSKNPGARAQIIQTGDGITFQMYGKDTGKSNTLVIRDTSGLLLNTSLSGGNYYEEESLVQLQTGFSGSGDIINPNSENKTFIYTVDGQRYTVTVTPNMTLGELTDEINSRHSGLASLEPNINDPSDPQVYFTLNRQDTHYTFAGDTGFNDLVGSGAAQFSDINANINTTGANYDVSVVVGNTDNGDQITKTITVKQDMTLMEFKNALQLSLGSKATVSLVQDGSTNQWYVGVQENPTVHRVTVEDGTLEEFAYQIPTSPQWSIIEGENARLKVNGWPGGSDDTVWMESASNTIAAGVMVEDISFTLLKTGETTITTGTDTAKIRENIEAFVDAVNSYRTILKSLTTVDAEKSTVDPTYANSQFEMQKGSILTGNYGIQTIESRLKSAIAGTAIGFSPRLYATDGTFLSGDIFSSLSQIGIKTNAQEGSTFFGLLEINYISGDGGSKSLDEALAEDPMAVARLFAANNEGFTDSADFGYGSQISGTTKAGNYTVKYTCTEDGKIDKAWINGEEAKVNNDTLQITSMTGASKGLVIDVYPHSLVAGQAGVANEITGTVSLREGKVNELLSMLNGTEGLLGTSGTLQTLEKNYQKIIDNIEGKITREDERLARWERTMINKFARLDAVLANYNAINEGLQSQIASLNASTKKS